MASSTSQWMAPSHAPVTANGLVKGGSWFGVLNFNDSTDHPRTGYVVALPGASYGGFRLALGPIGD